MFANLSGSSRTSKRIAAATLTLVFYASSAALAGEIYPRDQITFPFAPAAMAQGPGALRLNPAAVGVEQEFTLNYYHSYSDSSFKGDDALYTAFRGLGFGIEWLGSGAASDGKAYTIGVGTSGQKSFAVGSSYQWRSSDDPRQDKSHFWAHGFLWRPSNTVSFAGVVNNYNRMKLPTGKSDAEFTYSGAVRMLKGRLIVGADWYQATSQRLRDGSYRFAGTFEATPGMTLHADVDQDEKFNVGITLNMTTWFVGAHGGFDQDRDYRGGVAYAGYHKTRRTPVVNWMREVAMLDITGDIPDRRPARSFFGPSTPTTFDYLTTLEKVRTDPEIRALVVRISDPQLGWGRREELRRGIIRVRESGKPVLAYLDGVVSNGEYYLATAADLVVAPPVSTLNVIGLRSEVTFAKRLLDKIGIVADLEHVGEYKNASDMLTRSEMSPEHREAVTSLLDDLDAHWVNQLASSRHVTTDDVRGWIDHGPYVSVDAQTAGLIDTVAYADQLDGIIRGMAGPLWRQVSMRELRRRVYEPKGWTEPSQIALILAEGGISEGDDRSELLNGDVMGSSSIGRAIRTARESHQIKAIVLRVNSGGGSIFASDEIWREVARTVGHKPIIVSFGDVAASGGYYIACAADSIFAMPISITGSIGVITGKLDLSGLYDKVGLDKEVITRGRYADLYGTDGAFTDEEREVVRSQMMRAYDHFVSLVADGRQMDSDSVYAIAQGRVWSGTAAAKRGLVDRFADLHECITIAARMAGVNTGEDVEVTILPEQRWELFSLGRMGLVSALIPTDILDGLISTTLGTAGASEGHGEPAYEMPYRVTIR